MEASSSTPPLPPAVPVEILYRPYTNEDDDLPHIQRLVESELSEPYTVSIKLSLIAAQRDTES